MALKLDPEVWGPHYWFTLHTIALNYPLYPNDVSKKKYYDFVQNIPMFIPDLTISDNFSKILDRYPVTPYLDSRESFIKWMHFIHNKINHFLEKEDVEMIDALNTYYANYKPKEIILRDTIKTKERYIYIGILLSISIASAYLYKFHGN